MASFIVAIRQKRFWERLFSWGLVFATLGAIFFTLYITLFNRTALSTQLQEQGSIVALLYIDVVLLFLFSILIIRYILKVRRASQSKNPGFRTRSRLVVLFALVAIIPSILVTVFSALFLNFGFHSWFSSQVSSAIDNSQAIANAYLYEHQRNIEGDIFALANDLNRQAALLSHKLEEMEKFLTLQTAVRGLIDAVVIDRHGIVRARSSLSLLLLTENITEEEFQRAEQGEIILLAEKDTNKIQALLKLNRFVDSYLLVSRLIDPEVLKHVRQTETAVGRYQQLGKMQEQLQIMFLLIFTIVTLLLLLCAVWVGIVLADSIAMPVVSLIKAAERISEGQFEVYIPIHKGLEEFTNLGNAFNKMAKRLVKQRKNLMEVNEELDKRGQFTETVLSGVSAGIISLDNKDEIILLNQSACDFLGQSQESLLRKKIISILPETKDIMIRARQTPLFLCSEEIHVSRETGVRTLRINITANVKESEIQSFIITFDDITELISAQRKAAWSDVARRIAHEIKNPLTPIHLSAERLKRRYASQIHEEKEIYLKYIDTITTQVSSIGRMINEFSSFARMPQPVFKKENITEVIQEILFLEKNRNTNITWEYTYPEKIVWLNCDAQQMRQMLINILKNATEAIAERLKKEDNKDTLPIGSIEVTLKKRYHKGGHYIEIIIEDNGIGLSKDLKFREHLMEPYVTTRKSGSGLGLAIVKKIVDDHNGKIYVKERGNNGTVVSILFPYITI